MGASPSSQPSGSRSWSAVASCSWRGAVDIARAFDVSDRVIGLTIVVVGTSLPELAASLVAALRGHSDIAVGDVLGSNIFNVLLILGMSGLVSPLDGSLAAMRLDLLAWICCSWVG